MLMIAAFTLGLQAHRLGIGYNSNPYDEEDEMYKYDSWMGGWSMGENGVAA
jgi:hypothetical protein